MIDRTWIEYFNEANKLHKEGDLSSAAILYRCCFEAGHPYPAEALSSSLLCLIKQNIRISAAQLVELEYFDKAYSSYILSAQTLLIDNDAASALTLSGNCFEAFHTGTEPDRLYLDALHRRFHSMSSLALQSQPYGDFGRSKINNFPSNLIFYWDREPPREISENFQFHRDLNHFNVQVYDKQRAEAFLYDYYGREAKYQFVNLRHPAEEADYFRAHAIFAYGGCYLDADLRLRSASVLSEIIPYASDDVIFLTDGIIAHNDLIMSKPQSELMGEFINVVRSNCSHFSTLNIAMKTGPGALTRAVNKIYYRHLAYSGPVPKICILTQMEFDYAVESYDVSYKQDSRNWQSV